MAATDVISIALERNWSMVDILAASALDTTVLLRFIIKSLITTNIVIIRGIAWDCNG